MTNNKSMNKLRKAKIQGEKQNQIPLVLVVMLVTASPTLDLTSLI